MFKAVVKHDDVPLPSDLLESLLPDGEPIRIVNSSFDKRVNAKKLAEAGVSKFIKPVAGSATHVDYAIGRARLDQG